MKNIKTEQKKKKSLLESLSLFLIGLVLAGMVFGGLTINKLQKQNEKLNANQVAMETKIRDLESDTIDNQNKISQLTGNLEKVSADLTKSKTDLAYYRKLALAASQTPTNADTTMQSSSTENQIIKKTVYVKEKPKYETVVTIKGVGSYKVEVAAGDTAWTVLKKASTKYGFALTYQSFDFGVFVTSIAGQSPSGNQYWAFYYNGQYSQVGASDQKISAGDTTFWQLESF